MEIHALVPVKKLRQAKQRLAHALNIHERQALSLAMLGDVLAALSQSSVRRVTVISQDTAAYQTASAYGAAIAADRASDLNAALQQAAAAVPDNAAVLVAPSDIPLLRADDIAALSEQSGVTIVPAHDGGTNLLLVRPAREWTFLFGPNSCARHSAEARRLGLPVHMVYLPHLERDIDELDDLIWLAQQPGNTAAQRLARTFLESKGARIWR
ncbi:MAG: 2-phospho-L-lactate guanylyltransferase [Roseiflexus sp.]|nr:2-phospho-L-lactate guanylyltransferase [Roseiflexus sp.]MCS7291140.1 2-phospho-L-lactate guanylyltransferase [Roseiflexus sp.]MDW8147768.1 2-phospho-L-lactate guanylyltransferase [Roseiflexaceae bacterium]MDW8232453.1 2-phospho-L-lactate guanylyltransferase [Roseiflexaceae bacterium]